ncbi:MAG: hypothetical protein HY714_02320 [Candidatus Omnitrophica bacterium]|nr:hypothetical protein [Candidatus Omnitrophota bacterium]
MRRVFPACLSLILFGGLSLGAAPEKITEYPVKAIPWKQSFDLQTSVYQIDPAARVSSDFDLLFTVNSTEGPYKVRGLKKLAILVEELGLIQHLKTKESGGQFVEGAGDSVSDIGQGFVLLAKHPVRSVKNVGTATARFFKRTGAAIRRKKQKNVPPKSWRQKMFQGEVRTVANEAGADVYSENEALQAQLRRIARGRTGGRAALAVAKFFMPISFVGSIAMSASGVTLAADRIANTKDPWELYELNKKAYREMGLEEGQIESLLSENAFYNPREMTRIRFYLEALRETPGWQDLFKRSAATRNEDEAERFLVSLEMLISFMEKKGSLQEVGAKGEMAFALSGGKQLQFFLPFDFVFSGPKFGQSAAWMDEVRDRLRPVRTTVYTFGISSAAVKREVSSRGMQWVDGVFSKDAEEVFR